MSTFEWQPFLRQWSEEMLAMAEYTDDLPEEVLESRWLGFPGASEAQIVAAEKRLGIVFPPSYREFLKVTDGWRQPEAFWVANAGNLWSTEQVDWFSVRNQEWIDAYLMSVQEHDATSLPLMYQHLQTVLEVSDLGDAIYLLNPQVIFDNGEWEAWSFANWNPGEEKYPSFWDMMQAGYQSWKRYLPLYKGEMTKEEYNDLMPDQKNV